MVNPQLLNNIFFKRYLDVTVENTIKLLYRAKKLYDARDRATKILKGLVELNAKFQPKGTFCAILQQDSEGPLDDNHD